MENQRIRISKSMLKQGLLRLLQEKNINQISISELCDEAKINRGTFYKYYGNQYDLLAEIESDFFNGLESSLQMEKTADLETVTRVFTYLDRSREIFRLLVNSLSDEAFTQHLFQRPILAEVFENEFVKNATETERGYIYFFFRQGIYAIVREWLNKDEPEPPEKMAALILGLQKSFISKGNERKEVI